MTISTKQYRVIFWGAIIAGCVLLGSLSHLVGLQTIHKWGSGIDGWLLFLLMCLLPLVGLPMSVLSVMAGIKYGPWGGIMVAAVVVGFHLVASRWLARTWLRVPVEKILKTTHYEMPRAREGEYVEVCLLAALIPGPSYTLKNYFLVLSNLPFKIVLAVGLPAHLFAISPGIMFGDFFGAMTTAKGTFLVVYLAAVIGISHWTIRRLRAHRKPVR
jgi:uncharacterized membrane protein YdjX (TVP38/TMEM64 family)